MNAYEHALRLIAQKHRRDNPNRRVFTHDKAQAQYVELDPKTGVVRYNYRGTDVVTINPQGEILLDTGGWPTQSTKRCMERAFGFGGIGPINIDGSCLRAGDMPRTPRPWRVVRGPYWGEHTVIAEFEDAGPGVKVVTSVNQYTGHIGWGSNVSNYPRQTCLITPDML
jgi:hypothetical protein